MNLLPQAKAAFLVPSILGVLLGTLATLAQSATEKQLTDLEKEIDRAYVAADVAALQKIFAPDYTIVDADAHVTTGKQELDRLKSGQLRVDSSKLFEIHVRAMGETVLVSGHLTNSGMADGAPFSSDERLMDVWVRNKGRWQLVASQSTSFEKTDSLNRDREARAAIDKLDKTFVAAFNQGDVPAVAGLYTADAEVFAPDNDIARGAKAVGALWTKYLSSAADRPQLSHAKLEVEIHDEFAHMAGTFTAVSADGTRNGKYLLMLKPENGQWKIYREIWNSKPLEPKP